jgi:hypothetical protein
MPPQVAAPRLRATVAAPSSIRRRQQWNHPAHMTTPLRRAVSGTASLRHKAAHTAMIDRQHPVTALHHPQQSICASAPPGAKLGSNLLPPLPRVISACHVVSPTSAQRCVDTECCTTPPADDGHTLSAHGPNIMASKTHQRQAHPGTKPGSGGSTTPCANAIHGRPQTATDLTRRLGCVAA